MSDESISSSTEIERKYDVEVSTTLPEIADFQTTTVKRRESLHAIYYDTSSGALAGSAITCRLRTGGHDEGWHLKMPGQGGRVEHHAKVAPVPPAGILALVSHITQDPLIPVAVIDTQRTTNRIADGEGKQVAEFVDDLVSTIDLRTGIKREWREWEVELTEDDPSDPERGTTLLNSIEASLLTTGATPSKYLSKLARALGRTSLP